jgi:hypothetical protein
MKQRQYTDDMREISGMGGGYEEACRKMVLAGLDWFDAHPNAEPHFTTCDNVYGIVNEDNDDAKALSEAVCAAEDGCSGAMHQATISHIMYIHLNGWDAYCNVMRRMKQEEDQENTHD